jgi:hypothetical protein
VRNKFGRFSVKTVEKLLANPLFYPFKTKKKKNHRKMSEKEAKKVRKLDLKIEMNPSEFRIPEHKSE